MKSSDIKRTLFDAVYLGYLFTVALVVATQPSTETMMKLSTNAVIFGAFVVLGGLLSLVVTKRGGRTLGEAIFEPPHRKANKVDSSWYSTFWGWQLLIGFAATVGVGLFQTHFSIFELTDRDGFEGAVRLFSGILSPNFDILPAAVLAGIETFYIAFMATVLAIPVAFVLSFFASKNIMTHPVAFSAYVAIRTFLNVSRSIEPLIWAIIFSVWVGIGPFAGMLALMVHSIASLTKQYSETVEAVSEGPIEGIRSTGAGIFQVIWFSVVPQVVLLHVSNTIYRWDINIRMATIIGLVGGGGIGTLLIKYQGQALWAEVGCIFLVIAAMVWLMDTASAYIREAIK